MRKLNNKGFTLIELLAVVVILAVVMGIAMNSVLTAMNKSRGGSLSDTADVINKGFVQKYTESLVDGAPSNVYGGTNEPLTNGYDFTQTAVYYLDKGLSNTFNINDKGYGFKNSTNLKTIKTSTNGASTITDANIKNTIVPAGTDLKVDGSFVAFDVTDGKFTICMFANTTGSYWVDNYKTTADKEIMKLKIGTSKILTIKGAANSMFACTNGVKSW